MSVIAWDGKKVVADRQFSVNGMKQLGTKMVQLDTGEVLAFVGSAALMGALITWYQRGCIPAEYPDAMRNRDDCPTTMIVIDTKSVHSYHWEPYPVVIESPFWAWGSGNELAMGAMAMGADAERAVEIACQYSTSCGMGLQVCHPFERPPVPLRRKTSSSKRKPKKIPIGFAAPKARRESRASRPRVA